MQRTHAAVSSAAILLLAACGTSTSPSAAPPSAQASTAPTAASHVPSPTAAPATGAPTALPRPPGSLAWPSAFAIEMTPGTYFTSPPFVIPMTLEIAEIGWHAGHLNPVFIDLQRYDGVEVGGLPTRMLAFGWPENVRGNDGPVLVDGLAPEAAIDLIEERGSVEPGERARLELFGLAGERIDLHSELANNPIFGTAEGDFGLGPDLDLRLVALPLNGRLLMVGVLAPTTELEDAWEQALAILETVDLVE